MIGLAKSFVFCEGVCRHGLGSILREKRRCAFSLKVSHQQSIAVIGCDQWPFGESVTLLDQCAFQKQRGLVAMAIALVVMITF